MAAPNGADGRAKPAADSFSARYFGESIANAVPRPQRNPYLLRFSEIYNTRIPVGLREFLLVGPMLAVVLGIAYFVPYIVSLEPYTQGLTPHSQDMREYTLEPIYDEKGKIKGYRHINNEHSRVSS